MATLHESLLVATDLPQEGFNYALTFKAMTKRRLQRQFQGIYAGPSKVLELLAQLVWAYAIVVLLFTGGTTPTSDKLSVRLAIVILSVLFAIRLIADVLRSRLLLLVVYCAVAAHATFYAMTGDAGLFELSRSDGGGRSSKSIALIVLLCVEATIVFVYWAMYFVYPAVIANEWVDMLKWYDVQPGRRANTIVYRTLSIHKLWATKSRHTIQWVGELDDQLRPHGWGTWKDSSYHGETLSGVWKHGLPVGPFTSREHGSGYSSQQLRVAYAAYRSEGKPDEKNWKPSFPDDKTLRWGVSSVECSVAGGFFTFLPQVKYFFDRGNAPVTARECMKTLRTSLDDRVYRHTATHTVHPPNECHEAEAVVYIHGIFTSLEEAIQSCGRLFAAGDFPREIHPFVFSWPGGNIPVPYYWRTKQLADSADVSDALTAFVESIVDAGYTKIHFITHSMGTRVLLNTVERNAFKSLFSNGTGSSQRAKASASIASVTLCSPEFPLARFTKAGGTFDVLREYCSLVTIYGDTWDMALRGSELANRDVRQCGPLVRSLGCNVSSVVRDSSFPRAKDCVFVSVGAYDPAPEPPIQTEDTSDQVPHSYGSVPDYDDLDGDREDAQPRIYLDVDVINTSFTDSNVGNRHSYYRLNESIIEDIRAIIVHKNRAKMRAGVMRQQGNVFVLLTAPTDIMLNLV